MPFSRRESSAPSLDDKLPTAQRAASRKMVVLVRKRHLRDRVRSLLLPSVVLLIALSLVHLPLAHAGNGYYDMPAQTPEIIDSGGTHVGIIGSSFEFAHIAPSTDDDPLFYAGVEAGAKAGDTSVMYGVSNLHMQVTLFDPNGHAVSGQYLTIDKVLLSPDSNS